MSDDQLERRLRSLYKVEIVDPAPPLEPLRERIHAIPHGRRWKFPLLTGRRMLPVVVAIVVPLALVGFAILAGGTRRAPVSEASEIAFAHADYDPTARVRPSDLAIFMVSSDGGGSTRLADVPEDVPWPVSGLVGPAVRVSPDGDTSDAYCA